MPENVSTPPPAPAGTNPPDAERPPLDARFALPFGAEAAPVPEWIMWMPAGEHAITASRAGVPVSLRIRVDPSGAAAVEAARRNLSSESRQRPFFDFDHENKAASGWPLEFAWRDQPEPGIWARVEWSAAGREAIAGRTYRAFSPKFYDAPGDPAGIAGAPLNMGALTNDPAFRSIAPIWAKNPSPEKQQPSVTPMPEQTPPNNTPAPAPVAAANQPTPAPDREAEIAALKAELEKTRAALEAKRKSEAEAIVASHVRRGAIAPQDKDTQDRWAKLILADPENAKLLESLPVRDAVTAARGEAITATPRASITREAIEAAFTGYQDALQKDPLEAGHIYLKEFKPLLDKGERIPFERYRAKDGAIAAANVLGTLASSLIAQRTLDLIVARRPYLLGVTLDLSDEQARLNQTIITRIIGVPTVANFGSAATDTADTDVSVQLSNHKQVLYAFTAAEYLATARNLVEEHAEAQSVALGNSIVDALAALITTAFTSVTTGAANLKSYDDIATAAKALNSNGAPPFGRNMWVNSDFAEALGKDEILISTPGLANNASAYAQWRNVKGFDAIWEYPALPNNGINLIGFAFQRSALVLATRIADNPERLIGANYIGNLQVIRDPNTGLSLLSDRWIDPNTRALNTRLDVIYGVARGSTACGHRFVSA
jgi:hypothetical protein